jgi:amidohydrolase
MPQEAPKGRAAEAVDQRLGALVGISRRLHENPETAWRETASSAFLADELAARGFAVERGAAGLPTAFVAEYGAGAFTVGLVAEYDALPGLGHACGHNIIAATAVGAAEALADVAADLGIGIRVLGTPAEEGGGGKIPMLEAGYFDDLAFAMMIHPGPADAVYARPRAVAHFDVSYRGITSHAGAYPHLGRNAADAFTIAQVAIGLLRQQLAPSVRVHGIVTEAGTAPNAIPEIARGSWYVRADTLAELDGAFAWVRACFEAGALAAGCEWELTETSPRYAEFRNDEQLARLFAANGAALGRDMDLAETGPRGMATASTDMGNVSQRVRAIHPYLRIGSLPAVNHQPAFAAATVTPAGDRAVRDGAVLLAQTAIDAVLAGLFCWLQDQVGCPLRDDHDRDDGVHRGQGRKYRGVGHAEARDAVHAQPGVDDGARIACPAYPAGTAHVVDRLVDGPLDRRQLLVGHDSRAREDLPHQPGAHGLRRPDAAREADPRQQHPLVVPVWVGEGPVVDGGRGVRVGRLDPRPAPAARPGDVRGDRDDRTRQRLHAVFSEVPLRVDGPRLDREVHHDVGTVSRSESDHGPGVPSARAHGGR